MPVIKTCHGSVLCVLESVRMDVCVCMSVLLCGSLSVLKSVCRDMVNGVVFSIDTVTYEQQSM